MKRARSAQVNGKLREDFLEISNFHKRSAAALADASANEAETKNKAERVMLVRCVMVELEL